MKTLLTFIASLLSTLRDQEPPRDPIANFDSRDWADLPIYHPLCDGEPQARC